MLRIRRVARRYVFGAVPFHGALYFRAYTAGSGLHDESFYRLTVRCLSAFGKAGCSPEMSRRIKCTVFRRQAFVLSSPAHAAGAPASPDALCGQGTYFFTYGLPAAASRYLAIVRKRPLASVRCSVPPCASAIRTSSIALGCCVGSGWPLRGQITVQFYSFRTGAQETSGNAGVVPCSLCPRQTNIRFI